ncbi:MULTISPECIES: hypothetical protein [Arthrobacter]|uniref:Uncharacterized protein n=1 Tax=Arthrobacter terricola TaxID=2547396 RepID=A0A4R5K8Y5_9MICC|nr:MULTISPECIES: hypothetical protein [Arthrobacter]MBT8163082.1 hypothetical protein [Arthrobacter sp. GN70]TDF88122.1 hypothetical protein E1809_24185 [Arthrobacter terricola]
MFNGLHVLILAASILGGFIMIPRSIAHDRLLEEPEDIDYDLLDAERDTRAADDADAARKEHGF